MAKQYLCLCLVVVVFSATLASQAKAFTNPLEGNSVDPFFFPFFFLSLILVLDFLAFYLSLDSFIGKLI